MTRTLRSLRPAHRAMLFALLAAAMFARLLVPQGWMPAADGSARLTMCSGMGAMEMPAEAHAAMAKAMHGGKPDKPAGMDHPCTGAGLGLSLLAAGFTVLDSPHFTAFVATAFPFEGTIPGRGLAAPPPPATGPPLPR